MMIKECNQLIPKYQLILEFHTEIPYRILIIGGSGSEKTTTLLNLKNREPDIDKIYLYAKEPQEAKYQCLINKRENTGLKYLNDSKAFTEYSNDMDIYKKYWRL